MAFRDLSGYDYNYGFDPTITAKVLAVEITEGPVAGTVEELVVDMVAELVADMVEQLDANTILEMEMKPKQLVDKAW